MVFALFSGGKLSLIAYDNCMTITSIHAQEILDSRGTPTVEATVILESGVKSSAAVPSGASTGTHEAIELRDQDESRYFGKGVLKAVDNVEQKIAPALVGMDPLQQTDIDRRMLELDGTENKSNLGANAMLAVSMACTRVAAHAQSLPLYQYIAQMASNDRLLLPVPMMNILNGGKHARQSTDFQEFMIFPVGAPTFREALRWGAEVFHEFGKVLSERGLPTGVGDEGGYSVPVENNEQALNLILESITRAGYQAGSQIALGLDVAASEFYENGQYHLQVDKQILRTTELMELYEQWLSKYPIVSVEDALYEDDWIGFREINQRFGQKTQLVGDDLFVTNVERLRQGISEKAANSILIKLNQIGTVTETLQAVKEAHSAGWTAIISHRSGETEDTFIADLAVGTGVGQIKTGSLSRSERISKYNRLLTIEKELGENAQFASFPYRL